MKGFNAKISRIKAVLCAVFLALCVAGCDKPIETNTITTGNQVVTERVYEHGPGLRMTSTRTTEFTIRKFVYEGHTYLYFLETGYHVGYAGFTHDENCPCRKR